MFPLNRPARLAVFASGRGSNLVSILEAYPDNHPLAQVVLVMSNRKKAGALAKAEKHGVFCTSHPFPSRKHDPNAEARAAFEREASYWLTSLKIDLICLAGFMRIFSPEFTQRWQGQMLNIHPSLLPNFKGLHPQKQALDAGVKEAGCTVHFVEAGIDTGVVILQKRIPVLPDDDESSLAARILAQEHNLYPEAIRLVLKGKITPEVAL